MAKTREIRRRIRSITSTKKVTKAMELVASSKMRRAVTSVHATRPYADAAWELLLELARRTDAEAHPLLRATPHPKRIAVVLIASNRGLVGGFNAQISAAVNEYVVSMKDATLAEVDMVVMGKRGRTIFVRHGHPIAAEFERSEVLEFAEEVRPLAKLVIDGFTAGQYDRVVVGYMEYRSTVVQKPRIRQVLPLDTASFTSGEIGLLDDTERKRILGSGRAAEYRFEPGTEAVLDALLTRLVEMQIYRAVLETNASEHAARMVAMRNATDAAGELIDELTFAFNQARQQAITQDLSEISASRAALETETA